MENDITQGDHDANWLNLWPKQPEQSNPLLNYKILIHETGIIIDYQALPLGGRFDYYPNLLMRKVKVKHLNEVIH